MKKTIQQFSNITINRGFVKKLNKRIVILTGALILLMLVATTAAGLNGYFGGGSGSENIHSATLTEGLVGYWNFDEGTGQTANDASDSNNDGTLGATSAVGTDDPTWTSGKAGNGGALDFDGSSDYVDAGTSASLFSDTFTAAVWIYPHAYTNNHARILQQGTSGSGASGGYGIEFDSASGAGNQMAYGVIWNGTSGTRVAPSSSLALNTWHFVTLVYDGTTDSATFYVNGSQAATASSPMTSPSTTSFQIGKWPGGSGNFFDGLIDEARIYNRALSTAEVRYLYNRGGPVGHWKFDEGSGNTGYDSSGVGNHALVNQWKEDFTGSSLPSYWIVEATNPDNWSIVNNRLRVTTGSSGIMYLDSSVVGNLQDFELYSTVFLSSNSADPGLMGRRQDADSDTYYYSKCFIVSGIWRTRIRKVVDGVDTSLSEKTNSNCVQGTDLKMRFRVEQNGSGTDIRSKVWNPATTAEPDWEVSVLGDTEAKLQNVSGRPGIYANISGVNRYGEWDDWIVTSFSPIWTTGQFGTALDFDGTNDFAEVTDNDKLDFGTGDFTVSAWMKRSSNPSSDETIVAKKAQGADTDAGWMLYLNSSGRLMTKIGDGTNSATSTNDGKSITDNAWHHVAVTFDRDGNMVRYIDGIVYGSATSISTVSTSVSNAKKLTFARVDNESTPLKLTGSIDDVRVYDYVRTAAEVRLDYNAGFAAKFGGSPNQDVTRGLVGYWNFDEGNGQTAADSSGEGNDGTLEGNPTWTTSKSGLGGALDFNGTTDYVTIANESNFDFERTDTFSLSAWVNRDAGGGGIVTKHEGSGNTPGWSFGWESGVEEGKLFLSLKNAIGNALTVKTQSTFLTGQWHHVVATYSGNSAPSGVKIYVNGVDRALSTAENTLSATILNNIAPQISGRGGANLLFDGKMDEVRVYNRVLSAAEVRYLYNRGGPVGHWKFDEGSGTTAYDSSGNGNTGTLTNMDAATDWVTGQFGTALDFDGSNDYVTVADSSTLDLADFTLSAWVKLADDGTQDEIMSKQQGATARYFLHTNANGTVRVFYQITSSIQAESTTDIKDDQWHHVAGVREGTTLRIYVDGILEATTTGGDSGTINNSSALSIGQRLGTIGTLGADGLIDDVRIYDYARTAGEIRLDYNAGFAAKFGGSPNQDVTRGLVGYWNFEEGTGTTANDRSGNSNTGTLTNGPTWTSGKAGNGGTLDFDGSNDYVTVADNSTLDLADFTLSAWVKLADDGTQDEIMSKQQGATARFFLHTNANGTVRVFYQITSGILADSTTNIKDDQWHHVAGVRDGTTLRIYVDGILEATTTGGDSGTINNSSSLSIGQRLGTIGTLGADGLIDEARIYNRALSAAEVRYLYNRGGPVGHWKFDEGSGTTAYDSANNAGNGTITGATYTTGQFGDALNFDGIDDVVTVTNANPIDFDVGLKNAVTFSGWINADTAGEGTGGQVFWKGANTWVRVDTLASGRLDIEASLDLATTDATLNVSSAVATGTWHHVVMTYEDDSDDEISIYVDGRLVGTSTNGVGSPASDTNNLLIGGTTTNNFDGKIDDFRVYSYARSADEIRADYNAGKSVHFR